MTGRVGQKYTDGKRKGTTAAAFSGGRFSGDEHVKVRSVNLAVHSTFNRGVAFDHNLGFSAIFCSKNMPVHFL